MAKLDGARSKVQRAKEHFRTLAVKHQEFHGLNPFGVAIEHYPDTGERIWRARVSQAIPSEWSAIVGDVVHNLHAALDYVAWDLWVAKGGKPTDNEANSIFFPVVDPTKTNTPVQQKTNRDRNERLFGRPATALIDRLQLHLGRLGTTDPELRPLFLLHRLDIWDKHRRLTVVGGTVQLNQLAIGRGEDVHIDHLVIGGGDVRKIPIKDGTELLRLKLSAQTPDVSVEQQFVHFVAFDQDGPGKGARLVETLDELISFTDEAVTLFAALLK